MRTRAKWGVLGGIVVAAVRLGVGCGSAESDTGRICTPGNYVFCRCEDRSEGTKLCKDDGRAFDPCNCGQGDFRPPLSPTGDAGFTPVDAGQASGPSMPATCAGKLAVLASSDSELDLYAALYKGDGAFAVGKSQGPALRGLPHAAQVGGALVAVWLTRYRLIAWTKFELGQQSLAPPFSVGSAVTGDTPAIVSADSAAKLFYVGEDGAHHEGLYAAATGWNDATAVIPSPVPAGDTAIPGKSTPAAGAVGGAIVLGYAGSDATLAVQSFAQSAWDAPLKIGGAAATARGPAIAALEGGGSQDLLMVYVGSDLLLHSTTRDGATKTWSAPIVVDTTASTESSPEIVALANGRALIVWRATNGAPFYSVYDPARSPAWSVPSELIVGANPKVASTPGLTRGRCGSDATAAYAEPSGKVAVVRYENGAWTGPYVVNGLTNMTFVGVGELP